MSGNCARCKFSSILPNKYFLRKIFLSIVGLFTFVLVCLVIVMLWTIPDKPKVQDADVFCQHVDMATGDHVQCGPIQTEFHWYLKRKFAEENQHLLEKEKEYREKSKQGNQIDLKIYPKITTWKVRPAAKLVGKKHTDTSIDPIVKGLVPIRHWSHGRHMWSRGGYIRYGIRYKHGRFIVPFEGVYFVYSYLSLYEPCIPDTGLPNIINTDSPIEHGIFKYNFVNGTHSKILSGVQPHWKSGNNDYNQYSSYISSIIRLEAGDEVNVKISNISYLQNPEDNYFGIYLI